MTFRYVGDDWVLPLLVTFTSAYASPDALPVIYSYFSRSMRSSSPDELSYVLTLVAEFVASADCMCPQRRAVLRLASALLHDPPSGT